MHLMIPAGKRIGRISGDAEVARRDALDRLVEGHGVEVDLEVRRHSGSSGKPLADPLEWIQHGCVQASDMQVRRPHPERMQRVLNDDEVTFLERPRRIDRVDVHSSLTTAE